MISPLIYRLWETNITSAKFPDAWQADPADQCCCKDFQNKGDTQPRALFLKGLGQTWPIDWHLFYSDFCGFGRVFVWIVCVGHHFLFWLTHLQSQNVALHLCKQYKCPHIETLNLSVSPSTGQLPPVDQRPVFRSHHGGISVWDCRGQQHRDRLRWWQPDSQRH